MVPLMRPGVNTRACVNTAVGGRPDAGVTHGRPSCYPPVNQTPAASVSNGVGRVTVALLSIQRRESHARSPQADPPVVAPLGE